MPHNCSPHQQSSILFAGCGWKNCKTQILSQYLGEFGSDTRKQEELESLVHTGTANTKHSTTSSQINIFINPHSKGVFTSVSITWYNITSFQQKITSRVKREEETKQSSELDSSYDTAVEIIRKRIWNNCYYHIKCSNGKSRHHARKDGQYIPTQELETLRKSQKEMLELKNTIIEITNAFDGHISRLNRPRKESVSLHIGQ